MSKDVKSSKVRTKLSPIQQGLFDEVKQMFPSWGDEEVEKICNDANWQREAINPPSDLEEWETVEKKKKKEQEGTRGRRGGRGRGRGGFYRGRGGGAEPNDRGSEAKFQNTSTSEKPESESEDKERDGRDPRFAVRTRGSGGGGRARGRGRGRAEERSETKEPLKAQEQRVIIPAWPAEKKTFASLFKTSMPAPLPSPPLPSSRAVVENSVASPVNDALTAVDPDEIEAQFSESKSKRSQRWRKKETTPTSPDSQLMQPMEEIQQLSSDPIPDVDEPIGELPEVIAQDESSEVPVNPEPSEDLPCEDSNENLRTENDAVSQEVHMHHTVRNSHGKLISCLIAGESSVVVVPQIKGDVKPKVQFGNFGRKEKSAVVEASETLVVESPIEAPESPEAVVVTETLPLADEELTESPAAAEQPDLVLLASESVSLPSQPQPATSSPPRSPSPTPEQSAQRSKDRQQAPPFVYYDPNMGYRLAGSFPEAPYSTDQTGAPARYDYYPYEQLGHQMYWGGGMPEHGRAKAVSSRGRGGAYRATGPPKPPGVKTGDGSKDEGAKKFASGSVPSASLPSQTSPQSGPQPQPSTAHPHPYSPANPYVGAQQRPGQERSGANYKPPNFKHHSGYPVYPYYPGMFPYFQQTQGFPPGFPRPPGYFVPTAGHPGYHPAMEYGDFDYSRYPSGPPDGAPAASEDSLPENGTFYDGLGPAPSAKPENGPKSKSTQVHPSYLPHPQMMHGYPERAQPPPSGYASWTAPS